MLNLHTREQSWSVKPQHAIKPHANARHQVVRGWQDGTWSVLVTCATRRDALAFGQDKFAHTAKVVPFMEWDKFRDIYTGAQIGR